MGDVIDENELGSYIRYQHRVGTKTRVGTTDWSSKDQQWTLHVTRRDTGEEVAFTVSFLWMCQGYYEHAKGCTPA